MGIAENVAAVREKMDQAAREAGRDPKEVLLLAASKMNDEDRVREAIRAGVDVCGENRVQEMLEKQEKVVISQKGRIYELNLNDIVYIEAYGDGTYIYDNRDNVYECSVQLKEWNSRLEGKGFYKIHKSYIVSMRYVNGIVENQLKLEGIPAEFTISRRNAAAFKEAYLEYVRTNSRLV